MIEDPSSLIGDNLMYPFFLLAQKLKSMGHKVATIDTEDIKSFDVIIFIEFPGYQNKYFKDCIKNNSKELYLIISESPMIRPDNLDVKNHIYFKKIFTCYDDMVDNKKYFKLNYSHLIPDSIPFNIENRTKLCCTIASNKLIKKPLALYLERIIAIRWFEENHPQDFDLYGKGWDRYNFSGKILGINIARLNRLTFLTKLLRPHYPSWRGIIKSKRETYKKYKFSICYENATGFNGYITEKIFDCFFGGCIPIYLGAPNVSLHIPENTFIDKRKFKTYEKLYTYIKNMPHQAYLDYLENINKFLRNEKAYPFSADYFADTIIKEI